LVGPDAEKKSFMHALFLRNLTINPLILKVFALTKVGETSAPALALKEREFVVHASDFWKYQRSPLLQGEGRVRMGSG